MTLDELIKTKSKKNPIKALKEEFEKDPLKCLCAAGTVVLGLTVISQNAKIAELSARLTRDSVTHWNNTVKAAGALQAVADRLEPTFPGIEKEMIDAAVEAFNERGLILK